MFSVVVFVLFMSCKPEELFCRATKESIKYKNKKKHEKTKQTQSKHTHKMNLNLDIECWIKKTPANMLHRRERGRETDKARERGGVEESARASNASNSGSQLFFWKQKKARKKKKKTSVVYQSKKQKWKNTLNSPRVALKIANKNKFQSNKNYKALKVDFMN